MSQVLSPTAASRRRSLWLIGAAGVGVNVLIVLLAVSLLGGPRTGGVEPPRRLAVPYEDEASLWEPFRRWVVQDDGRNKPFDTFCRESVRAVTGRERFEEVRSMTTGHLLSPGHEPVAVVASWLLGESGDDWEQYPFLWCRHGELRRRLYGDDRPGHHVEPATVRGSPALLEVLREAFKKRAQDSRAVLSPLEREAVDLQGRLELYDRIRHGGEVDDGRDRPHLPGDFQAVSLDRDSPEWFSLATVNAFAAADGDDRWRQVLQRRRLTNPELYQDSAQPLPAAEISEILSTFTALREAYRSGDGSRLAAAAAMFFAALEQTGEHFGHYPGTDTVEKELWYHRANPFRKAWLFDVVATLLFGAGLLLGVRWPRAGRWYYAAGLLAAACCLGWAVTGFTCRVAIVGRPPVSNMYESIIWVAFMVLTFGLILEAVYRRGVIALAAALVSTLGFVLADQLPLTFSPALQPLQAVLRSNYWLTVHVLTIVSSYAPFALAWGLGNLNLGLILFAPGRHDLIRTQSRFCYRAIQVGVLLLFLGTMLGGFWAAESWGRFWGWDPKEVWALIALLCYVIPLHARYLGWVGDVGLAVASVICFASVVMAWYGVNFVLGAGLHSYGFGSGDDRWVYLVGLLNISLVLHAAWRYLAVSAQAGPGSRAEEMNWA